MTKIEKNELISRITAMLNDMISTEPEKVEVKTTSENSPIEMLTIKECSQAVKGLSEHTIRQLVIQEKIPYIRTGEGKRGKVLINKSALLDYLQNST